jgi:pyruvate/2-oxoglutarate dehydrogenase complex dihydrolipoamide acyltransferase (E2) component
MSSSRTDLRVEVVMPSLGISVAEGTVVAWRKQPGERVDYEEAICDIATDKIESELPAPASGTVVDLLVAAGETVDVGSAIAVIAADAPVAGPGAELDGGADGPPPPEAGDRSDIHSPVVRKLADEHGVDLATIEGTGTGGRVRKQDVLARVSASQAPGGAPYEPPAPQPLSRQRLLIGAHMKRSLDEAATVTSWIEVDFSAVERTRAELGTTALSVVAAATLATLVEYPELNAWLDGDTWTRHTTVNLGIAVAIDGGLIVPVIRSAEELEISELAERIRSLATRARAGSLTADELRGGTFTITNPGQFGTLMATPILNQPEVAILDVEAIVKRAVVVEDDRIEVRPVCILGLSWDHRALDGALAARFLGALRDRLQS